MKIELDEKTIDNLVKYIKEHPKEIYGLLETFDDQIFDVLKNREVLVEAAKLYNMFKKEIQMSQLPVHKCPVCRYHPLETVLRNRKRVLHCSECGWTASK